MTEIRDPDWLDVTAYGADTFAAGLRAYIHLVATELGVGPQSCATDPRPPASAYVALDVRLTRYPGRDVALLWDERHGWSACVETYSGEDLIVVAYRGHGLLPAPASVRAFVRDLAAGLPAGRTDPPAPARCDRETLTDRLRACL